MSGHDVWPGRALGEQVREVDLEDAELVVPGVAEDAEVVAAFLLVVLAGGAEGFEAADFGLAVVGFEVEVYALLVRLGIGGPLEQNADVRVGESEFAVDLAAGLAERFLLRV
jgi:hypothetical protein